MFPNISSTSLPERSLLTEVPESKCALTGYSVRAKGAAAQRGATPIKYFSDLKASSELGALTTVAGWLSLIVDVSSLNLPRHPTARKIVLLQFESLSGSGRDRVVN